MFMLRCSSFLNPNYTNIILLWLNECFVSISNNTNKESFPRVLEFYGGACGVLADLLGADATI